VAIEYLSLTNVPIIWWVHESKESYQLGANALLPQNVGDNIHIYCGGAYAQKLLIKCRPTYSADVLLYGMPDKAKTKLTTPSVSYKSPNKPLFIVVGTVEQRKGQDIFAKAVMAMPREIVEAADFLVVGRKIHEKIYNHILQLKKQYPDNVTLVDEVSRDEINNIYASCDYVVCASRDDPMPVFVTEGMMFSKVCICSENTGTASLIQDGKNGFIYHDNDHKQLAEKIQYAILHHSEMETLKQNSRKIYDMHFSMDIFNKNISDAVNKALKEV